MTNKKEKFLFETYKQNREYMRESEDVHLKHVQFFFLLVMAILSFFGFILLGEIQEKSFVELILFFKQFVVYMLVFLSIYATILTASILIQKYEYEKYCFDDQMIRAKFNHEECRRKKYKFKISIHSSFTWLFGSILIITIALWMSMIFTVYYI